MSTTKPSATLRERRRLRFESLADTRFFCRKCGKSKRGSEWDFDERHPDGIGRKCRQCATNQGVSLLDRLKKDRGMARQLQAGIMASGCVVCGEAALVCLQFHHADSATKEHQFSDLVSEAKLSRFIESLSKEVAVVCANCHLKVHAGLVVLDVSHFVVSPLEIDGSALVVIE